ncbi:hypothetical protein Droror1_Dr00026588 [Drosera rotundifolia]
MDRYTEVLTPKGLEEERLHVDDLVNFRVLSNGMHLEKIERKDEEVVISSEDVIDESRYGDNSFIWYVLGDKVPLLSHEGVHCESLKGGCTSTNTFVKLWILYLSVWCKE